MKKILLLKNIIFFLLFNNCSGKTQTSLPADETKVKEETQSNIEVDTTKIANRLNEKMINKLVFFDKDTLSVPFNYSMKANNKAELLFLWQLGDLEINSELDNYFSFGFEDQVPFRDEKMSGGNMHLVWTNNSEAITISKVKNQLKDIDEIYYSDNQSLIFRKRKIINTLFFEYLEDKKAFAVYLSYNDYLWFSKFDDITLEQKLDVAIGQLAFAKQFFKNKKTQVASDWKEYEKNLNNLNLATINESYEEIKNTIKKSIFNEFIELQKMDFYIMNLQTDNTKLWQDIQNFYSKKITNIESIRFPNFEKSFGKYTINEVEYMDNDAIIVNLKDNFDHQFYATIVKTKIQGKEVILSTKNIKEGFSLYNPSKEMNYFYLNLFKNFGNL